MSIDRIDGEKVVKYNSLKELVSKLVKMAANFYCKGCVDEIYYPSRKAPLVKARIMVANVLLESLKCSYTTVAQWLGRTDHTTAKHWHEKFNADKLSGREGQLYEKMKSVAYLSDCNRIDYTYPDFIDCGQDLRDKSVLAWTILRRISDFYGIEVSQLFRARGKHNQNAMLGKARAISYYTLREYFAYTKREIKYFFGINSVDENSIPEFSNIERYFISDLQIYLRVLDQRYKIFSPAISQTIATPDDYERRDAGAHINANKELLTIEDINMIIKKLFQTKGKTELTFTVYVRYPGSARFMRTNNFLTARIEGGNVLYSASWSNTPPSTIDVIKCVIENTGVEGTKLRFKLEGK